MPPSGDFLPVKDGHIIANWGSHLQAGRLRHHRVTSSPCRTATSSPTRGLHLQPGRLRRPIHRRLGACTSRSAAYAVTDDIVPVQDSCSVTNWGPAPPGWPTTPSSGDIVPMQDGYFVAGWSLAPPGRPPTPSSGDIIPVQDGQFVIDWGLAPPGWPPTPLPGDIVPVQDDYLTADYLIATD
uniref:Uncharacterized protein n=1 Tax=Oryza punctata TaxID=4537 RepID=A0A0E0LZV1_ORYPU